MSNARDLGRLATAGPTIPRPFCTPLAQGDGVIELEAGDYLISKTHQG